MTNIIHVIFDSENEAITTATASTSAEPAMRRNMKIEKIVSVPAEDEDGRL